MTASDPRSELSQIKARADKATPGPWTHGQAAWGLASNGPDHVEVSNFNGDEIASLELDPEAATDAEFIAHARTDVDRLAEALEAVLSIEPRELLPSDPDDLLFRSCGRNKALDEVRAAIEAKLSEEER